ncbi:uncharacterized protein BCR38DRAFT_477173 [Pseudomassariella vexata]|uniref:Uncharacterized protein n=1 Tax=Pseudomassariella vexata TaxID=1141098 RepID=A0A1Y2DK20_9PEZI|nr:uncharacterized protein BCR38DRAFT_477173 [Pseudomassariella vexata]ORY59539.1 hypothetical protein BCR38DRAFT_477173 [Pseudomassariella vexata]
MMGFTSSKNAYRLHVGGVPPLFHGTTIDRSISGAKNPLLATSQAQLNFTFADRPDAKSQGTMHAGRGARGKFDHSRDTSLGNINRGLHRCREDGSAHRIQIPIKHLGSFRPTVYLGNSVEEHIMQRGDIAVQRYTAHRWINITGNGFLAACILFVLLEVKDVHVSGGRISR